MVRINIFDYIKRLRSNAKFENKSFEETKKDLEELHEYNIILEELENGNFLAPENSIYLTNEDFIQTRLLISEITKKQEITERLSSLSYNVGWLKAGAIIKDKNIVSKAIENITQHEHSSINIIVSELNSLKSKIERLESLHTRLLDNNMLSLDTKIMLQQDFGSKHEKLNELHNKQKNILLNLSSIFVKLTKETVFKKKKK
ncbi:MAG: hypothetical protein V1831_01470 [Candidatus Woesearchaeota archaeon]